MTKILLVDDSKFLRMATERALARAGYQVSTAEDGPSVLERAKREKPDVILLDMLLPKMTGPEVLKGLKSDPTTAGIAVVIFTGYRTRMQSACGRMAPAPSWKNRDWLSTREARRSSERWQKSCDR